MKDERLYSEADILAIFDQCARIANGYDMPCEPRTEAEQTAHNIIEDIGRAKAKWLANAAQEVAGI